MNPVPGCSRHGRGLPQRYTKPLVVEFASARQLFRLDRNYPTMASPGQPPVPPRPWPKRRPDGSKGVPGIVLAAIIVAIALAFVSVGAVLLRITVSLEAPTPCGTSCWDVVVTGVSTSEPLWSYTVSINIEETGSPQSAPLAPGPIFDSAVRLTFTDVGMPNHLDAGDAFRLENPGNAGNCTLDVWSFRASASVSWVC